MTKLQHFVTLLLCFIFFSFCSSQKNTDSSPPCDMDPIHAAFNELNGAMRQTGQIRTNLQDAPALLQESLSYVNRTQILLRSGNGTVKQYAEVVKDDCKEKGVWREVGIKDRLQSSQGCTLLSAALVFEVKKKAPYVAVFQTSCSGDWAEVAEYFYREDGSLAYLIKIDSTFYAARHDGKELNGIRIVERRAYDKMGQLINTEQMLSDLKDNKPLDPAEVSYQRVESPIHLKASEWPFL